jgi:hypothetical protein
MFGACLFSFFEIGVADDNGFDWRVFDFGVRLCNGHAVNLEDILYRRIAFSQSYQASRPARFHLWIWSMRFAATTSLKRSLVSRNAGFGATGIAGCVW